MLARGLIQKTHDRCDERVGMDGLRQKQRRAGLECGDPVFQRNGGAQHDDRHHRSRRHAPDGANDISPVAVWKVEIEDDDAGRRRYCEPVECCLAGTGLGRGNAGGPEHRGDQLARVGMIVDNESDGPVKPVAGPTSAAPRVAPVRGSGASVIQQVVLPMAGTLSLCLRM